MKDILISIGVSLVTVTTLFMYVVGMASILTPSRSIVYHPRGEAVYIQDTSCTVNVQETATETALLYMWCARQTNLDPFVEENQ